MCFIASGGGRSGGTLDNGSESPEFESFWKLTQNFENNEEATNGIYILRASIEFGIDNSMTAWMTERSRIWV